MRIHRQALAMTAATLAAAVALGGCGSSGSSTGDTGTAGSESQTAAAKPSGEPVRIGVAAPVGSPIADYPGVFAGAQAAARALNAAGGAGGREIIVQTCNTQGNPKQEVACARKFAADGVVATVGSLVFADPKGYLDTLAAGGIADVGAMGLDKVNYQAENSYPIDFFQALYTACGTPQLASDQGNGSGRIAGVVSELPTSKINESAMQAAAEHTGVQYVGSVSAPTTTPDYAPIIRELGELDANVVGLAMPGPGVIGTLSAAATSGKDWVWCAPGGWSNSAAPLMKLGQNVSEFFEATTMPPLTSADKYPELKEFIDEMAAEADAGNGDARTDPEHFGQPTLRSWLALRAVADVLGGIDGEVTPQAFQDAISSAKVDLGLVPPIDFAQPVGEGEYPRVFNPEIRLQKWNVDAQDWDEMPDTFNAVELLYGS